MRRHLEDRCYKCGLASWKTCSCRCRNVVAPQSEPVYVQAPAAAHASSSSSSVVLPILDPPMKSMKALKAMRAMKVMKAPGAMKAQVMKAMKATKRDRRGEVRNRNRCNELTGAQRLKKKGSPRVLNPYNFTFCGVWLMCRQIRNRSGEKTGAERLKTSGISH